MGVVTNKITITKIFCIMNQTCSYIKINIE